MQKADAADDDATSMNPEKSHPAFFGYKKDKEMNLSRAFYSSRQFAVDVSPRLVLAAGNTVDNLINSGVGNYLEFKAIESVYFIGRDVGYNFKSTLACTIDGGGSSSTAEGLLLPRAHCSPVPCSKGDVFNSKLLRY